MDRAYPIRSLSNDEYPSLLREIPDPPTQLRVRGEMPLPGTKILTVVGSRNYSNYGKEVVEYLIGGLRHYPITLVSGLALGIDTLVHEAALTNALYTLAIPGSGLDERVLYPVRNRPLAYRILEAGGGLLSEYDDGQGAAPWTFPQRNRIMAGIAHATLIIEAGEKSGTLITARLATDYNRDVLVVPGNIFSENSRGAHQFLKLGATPITTPDDILEALHIDNRDTGRVKAPVLTHEEEMVLGALAHPTDRDTLIRILDVEVYQANILLTEMELKGLIHESQGILYRI